MSVVTIQLAGPPSTSTRFTVSPLAEMGAYLHALRGRDPHPRLESHRDDVMDAMAPETAYGMVRFAPLWAAYHCRLLYADIATDPEPTLLDAVRALDDIDDGTYLRWIVWACIDGYRMPRITPDVHSSSEMYAFQAAAAKLSPARGALAVAASRDLAQLRDDLRLFLTDFAEKFFTNVWREIAPALRGEVRDRKARLERDASTVFGGLPGMDLQCDPWRLDIRKSSSRTVSPRQWPLTCIPTYFGTPHVLVKAEPGHPIVLHYPFRMGSTIDAQVAQKRLRLIASDERLELLRLLAREELSTTELGARLGMSAPQTSRHLRALRNAGLVNAERRQRFVYYALDLGIVNRMSAEFLRGLMT